MTGENAMCDERERLIGYVYDECGREERRAIEAHLEGCPECRGEIGGLRAVREDLLAWEVPAHAPVWRPLPVPRQPSWREIPAWAMAAAASLIFLTGAAGGAATRLVWPADAPPAPAGSTQAAVTAGDLAALKASLLGQMRAEMAETLTTVAAHDQVPRAVAASAQVSPVELQAVRQQLTSLEQWRKTQDSWRLKQIELNKEISNSLSERTTSASYRLDLSRQLLTPVSMR
jgi:Putative zinc-finger